MRFYRHIIITNIIIIIIIDTTIITCTCATANCDWAKEKKELGERLLDRRKRTSERLWCDVWSLRSIYEICGKKNGKYFLIVTRWVARNEWIFALVDSIYLFFLFFSFFYFLTWKRVAITLRQLMCRNQRFRFFFHYFFLIEKRSRAKDSPFSAKDEWCVWEREGKGTKRKKESDKTAKKYKGNTVPITPVWKLSYKNHIQGQEEQSIMLVLIAIYMKAQ